MANKSMAKALKRKIGLDESILTKIESKPVEVSLLMNPSRRRIFMYICNFPCSHIRGISRATDLSVQNVRWHLIKLRNRGLISEHSHGKKKIYTPFKNAIKPKECNVLTLLGWDDIRMVYLHIEKKPKATQKEMCKALKIYQQKLSKFLLSLENSHLITHENIGREKAYSSTGLVKEVEDAFYQRSKGFEKALIKALENDGLNPGIKSSDKDTLWIQLNFGGEETPILKLRRNPMKTLMNEKR